MFSGNWRISIRLKQKILGWVFSIVVAVFTVWMASGPIIELFGLQPSSFQRVMGWPWNLLKALASSVNKSDFITICGLFAAVSSAVATIVAANTSARIMRAGRAILMLNEGGLAVSENGTGQLHFQIENIGASPAVEINVFVIVYETADYQHTELWRSFETFDVIKTGYIFSNVLSEGDFKKFCAAEDLSLAVGIDYFDMCSEKKGTFYRRLSLSCERQQAPERKILSGKFEPLGHDYIGRKIAKRSGITTKRNKSK